MQKREETIKRISVIVKGKVQGVYYRASAKEVATRLGLVGFVKNQKDGDVYLEAEGSEDQLDALITWCKRGPQYAVVDRVEVIEIPIEQNVSFEIMKY
jgi:acylphosphatase